MKYAVWTGQGLLALMCFNAASQLAAGSAGAQSDEPHAGAASWVAG